MKKLIGETWVDSFRVKVYATSDKNVSQFFFPRRDNPYGVILASIIDTHWDQVSGQFMHEWMEAFMSVTGGAFVPTDILNKGSDSRIFMMPHSKFNEMAIQLAGAFADIESELLKTWRKYHKDQREKGKKKK